MTRHIPLALLTLGVLAGCESSERNTTESASAGSKAPEAAPPVRMITGRDIGASPDLPRPNATPSGTKFAQVIGWSGDAKPKAPDGFTVTLSADSLEYPRWMHVLPSGDLLVAEARTDAPKGLPENVRKELEKSGVFGPSANRISRLRDKNGDGHAETRETFLDGLKQPFGMLALGQSFYVANTDALLRYPFDSVHGRVTGQGRKILDLPAGGYNNHWTRNVVASRDGSKLYVTVGSGTNVDQEKMDRKDQRRAAVLEVNPDGSGMRVFASGLRNPNGLDWEPTTRALWTAVNERDELGDELVPTTSRAFGKGRSTAGRSRTGAPTKTPVARVRLRSGSPRRLLPTSRPARTPRRSASCSAKGFASPTATSAARSSASTGRGTGAG